MDGRVAVVTGGGTGIGRAVAATLVARGDRVAILGRRPEVLEATAGELGCAWRQADVTVREQVQAAVDWVVAELGPGIDVLVNNAGGIGALHDDAPLEEAERVWDEVVDANLKGPFLMSRATVAHLRRPGGRIVNLSSIAAWTGRGGPYAAAKAGVAGLTYSLALELGPLGITANAVAPGFIEDTEFFGSGLSEQGRRERLDRIPAGRPGHPDEIAAAVAYLTSPKAGYVNGEVHHVNGGWLFGR
jgi:NAD(P)-dependent dehydrogenase (short-subunit alcohol dehydrogenase family)